MFYPRMLTVILERISLGGKPIYHIKVPKIPKHFPNITIIERVVVCYRKIPIKSPGLIFVQKAFLLGLFSGERIFGGDCYWKEFCVS